MSLGKQNDNHEMLSFDELKGKLNETEDKDTSVENLLEDLQKLSPDMPKTEVVFERTEETKKEQPEEKNYKSIYDDVLKSVMQPSQEEENTSRKQKYTKDAEQFVDVTKVYENYGTQHPEEKEVMQPDSIPQVPQTEERAPKKEYKSFKETFLSGLRAVFPNKNDSTGEKVRKVISNVAFLVLIGCFVYFGAYAIENYQEKKQQQIINGYVMPDDLGDASLEGDEWAQFLSKYPNVKFPEGMMKKYAYLYAINPDLVGWVKVPGTMINIQVVQSGSSQAEYLRKDFYGNKSRYGTPYMDYRDDPKYLGHNTTIYGHHMSDGLVFADLKKYKTIEGFKENPIFYFDTLYKHYAFKVYAVIISNSKEEDDDGYIFNYTVPNFKSGDHFMSYIEALNERTLYTTGVDIQPTDKLVTLSTCTYEFSDARLAIVGRMVRDGESEVVDVSLAQVNPEPRYPQAWYDKKGIDNPFAGAPKWYY